MYHPIAAMTSTEPKNSPIFYAHTVSSFGPLLLACTVRGICFLGFSENPEVLLSELDRHFPKNPKQPFLAQHHAFLKTLLAAIRGNDFQTGLPLDIHGTPFQVRVWRELQSIPRGITLTYTELAEKIGKPTAIRAVASACARNPIAILIPCHRVVAKASSGGGYRWGKALKEVLLRLEAPTTLSFSKPLDTFF